jgi:hypothetical protein
MVGAGGQSLSEQKKKGAGAQTKGEGEGGESERKRRSRNEVKPKATHSAEKLITSAIWDQVWCQDFDWGVNQPRG